MNFPFMTSQNPVNERIGRRLKNSFGVEETVVLPERHWKHFDWLQTQGVDMEVWVKNTDIDRYRPEYKMKLSGELEASLFIDEKRRYLSGVDCPLFITPDGYKGKIQKLEIHERLASDNDLMERPLQNLLGVSTPVKMLGKYWRYFDWLSQRGDMEQWVIDADFECRKTKRTLSEELSLSLRRHERTNYLNKKNITLFITQSGYFNLDVRTDAKEGIERDVIDSKGDTVSIPLPKQYWKYFDWLGRQGIDMKQWVLDSDVSRDRGKIIYSLRSELILTMQDDEKRRFKSDDEPCPFILRPDGY